VFSVGKLSGSAHCVGDGLVRISSTLPKTSPKTRRKKRGGRRAHYRARRCHDRGWANVHGLATLLIDGNLSGLALAAAGVESAVALVEAAIEQMRIG
jgi:hypothetical protein